MNAEYWRERALAAESALAVERHTREEAKAEFLDLWYTIDATMSKTVSTRALRERLARVKLCLSR